MYSIESIDLAMKLFLDGVYPRIFRYYILWTVACGLLFFILPTSTIRFLQWMDNKNGKKAYLFKMTSPKIGHYIFCFSLIFVGVRNTFANTTMLAPNGRITALILAIIMILAAIQLFRWRASGILLSYIGLFLFALHRNYMWIVQYRDDLTAPLIDRYTFFPYNECLFFIAESSSVFVVIVSTIIAIYYYRRRFLFRNISAVRCRKCGNFILPGDNYCTCCGMPMIANPRRTNLPKRLDYELYCRKCGKQTNRVNNHECLSCKYTNLNDVVKKKLREKLTGSGVYFLLACIAFAILFIPIFDDIKLERGSASANNAYVKLWNEYAQDQAIAEDHVWLQEFNSALNALYTVDMRWFYVKPRDMSIELTPFFMDYGRASYKQLQALADMRVKVNDGHGDIEQIQNEFNDSINLQAAAIADKIFLTDGLVIAEHFVINAIRYWSGKLHLDWLCIPLIIIALFLQLLLLNSFDERRVLNGKINIFLMAMHENNTLDGGNSSVLKQCLSALIFIVKSVLKGLAALPKHLLSFLFTVGSIISLNRPSNYIAEISWAFHGLFDTPGKKDEDHKDFKRMDSILTAIAVLIWVVVIMVCVIITNLTNAFNIKKQNEFDILAKTAVQSYSIDISKELLKLVSTNTHEDPEGLIRLIDKQIEADQAVLDYEGESDDAELMAGVKQLCADDIASLTPIRDAIDQGLVPSQSMVRNFYIIRAQNYKWVLERMAIDYSTEFITGFM